MYKGKIDQPQFKVLITGIAALVAESKLVTTQKEFLICRDPADNMILECCFAAQANILITGDKDLLDIKSYPSS
ncbi:MAG TPA: putative toxin-antitoxin system toxin component, PIN family [Deltaproteobacteria bacterium]|nr:putative toxin-antitoxin system toxin component, PIN family [Deltaproteobacteria bacterium]